MAKALMFMGTGSDVGKSLLVAGLCRAFANRGLRVAPFKPQNMSNNAAVTADGGEIGRAQALQARAARSDPVTAMNPILLKPEGETGAQLIVRGKRIASMGAKGYFKTRGKYLPDVLAAFHALAADADLVLVEGAGSASEVNLRDSDLANFGFARAADVPVVVIGDIERGGVIASLVGTLAVIAPEDRGMVRATLINKFRGDPALFAQGMDFIAQQTGLPSFGPLPMFEDARKLPAEDALGLDADQAPNPAATFRIAVPRLPRIANFDDLDPLRAEPGISVEMVQPGTPLPRDADLVILPGSKATMADLAALRAHGWDIDLAAHVRAGGAVLGICGGYQMLGRSIADPEGIEGPPAEVPGLGLLDVRTVLGPEKELRIEKARDANSEAPIEGYHMHMGTTEGPDRAHPFAIVGSRPEGAVASAGRVMGTYLHGVFAGDEFRRIFLARKGLTADPSLSYQTQIEEALDGLAAHLETHLDLDALLALAGAVERRA